MKDSSQQESYDGHGSLTSFLSPGGTFFFHFSSSSHFVRQRETICAIMIEGIMGSFVWNCFELGLVVQEEMSLKKVYGYQNDARRRLITIAHFQTWLG